MNKVLKELLNTVIYILVLLGLSYLLVMFVVQRVEVQGESMEPTLSNGDNLFVDKISYRFRDPERFDIIVFPPKGEPDKYYIKRIIGLPGETVQIDENGNIYIDGELLIEGYGKEVIDANHIGLAAEPIELGVNEYFVLGDNRNNSTDSRYAGVGNVKRSDIVGRAWIQIWPLNKIGLLKHQ